MIKSINEVIRSLSKNRFKMTNKNELIQAINHVVSAEAKQSRILFNNNNHDHLIKSIKTIASLIELDIPSNSKYVVLKSISRHRDENLHSDYICKIINDYPEILSHFLIDGLFLRAKREVRLDYLNPKLKNEAIGARRIDILIETSNSFLIIENKVDSYESENQTIDYFNVISDNTSKEVKGILLSPSGIIAQCEGFESLTYLQLANILNQLNNKNKLVEQYISELYDIFVLPYIKGIRS